MNKNNKSFWKEFLDYTEIVALIALFVFSTAFCLMATICHSPLWVCAFVPVVGLGITSITRHLKSWE